MRQLLFLILFLFSLSALAEEGRWEQLYDFNTTMAARGSVEAEYKLGEMNEEGQGTQKNLQVAREWYLKAASHGHVRAEYKLGTIYEYGIGVTVDKDEAKRWYEKAASHGIYMAKRKLNEWEQNGKKKEAAANIAPVSQGEENKVRQVEQEKLQLEQKRKSAADAQLKKQVEEDKARQAAAPKRADEQRARQTAQTNKEIAQPPSTGQKAVSEEGMAEKSGVRVVATDGGEKDAFETDPCKTPAARFMSTCKNK